MSTENWHKQGLEKTGALLDACLSGDIETIRQLVGKGVSVAYENDEETPKWSPLVAAVSGNQLEAVKELLKLGAKASEFSSEGKSSPLHLAVEEEYLEILNFLLTRVSTESLNRADYVGRSLLIIAAELGNIDIAKVLLENGSLVDFRDVKSNSNTALASAVEENRVEMVEFLILEGADPFIPGWMSMTAWDRCESADLKETLKRYTLFCDCLIDPRKGFDLNVPQGTYRNTVGNWEVFQCKKCEKPWVRYLKSDNYSLLGVSDWSDKLTEEHFEESLPYFWIHSLSNDSTVELFPGDGSKEIKLKKENVERFYSVASTNVTVTLTEVLDKKPTG